MSRQRCLLSFGSHALAVVPRGGLGTRGSFNRYGKGAPQIEGTLRTEAKAPSLCILLSVVGTKQVLRDVGRPAEGRREQWMVGGREDL